MIVLVALDAAPRIIHSLFASAPPVLLQVHIGLSAPQAASTWKPVSEVRPFLCLPLCVFAIAQPAVPRAFVMLHILLYARVLLLHNLATASREHNSFARPVCHTRIAHVALTVCWAPTQRVVKEGIEISQDSSKHPLIIMCS